MKKLILVLVILLTTSLGFANTDNTLAPSESISGRGQQILQAYSQLQNLQHSLTQKEIALKFEKNFDFPSLKEIERIDGELVLKFEELDALGEREGEEYEGAYVLEEQISDLKDQRQHFESAYELRREKQQQKIVELTSEIEDIGEEIVRQDQLFRVRIGQAGGYFGILFGVIILLLVFKLVGKLLINKFTTSFLDNRRESLKRINRYTFNTIIGLVILGGFFSQLVNLLPFIAILGTGMAFAVRDSISCFIAWFVIGTKRGYKVGDIIRVGDVFGKVYEIGPFLTVVQGLEGGRRTNRFFSFPNKVVFEEEVEHYSSFYGVGEKRVSFYVNSDANLLPLEEELLRMARDKERFCFFDPTNLAAEKIFDKNHPQVLIESEQKVTRLDLLFFVDVEKGDGVASEITKSFMGFIKENYFGILVSAGSLADKK